MDELVEVLRNKLGPGGDLYLNPSHADMLIHWINHARDLLAKQTSLIVKLQSELEFHVNKESRETQQ